MAYTVHDTPDLVHRIDGDLDRVLAATRKADPELRALVLTGGFARGEGSVLDGKPQNDYDFVAVRGVGRPKEPYPRVAHRLEHELGLHIDLAPIPAWRLRHVARSVFWYETALRGRTLWGEDLLDRIPVRSPRQLDRAEGLRLLVNRSAGLLLVTGSTQPHAHRIQASKALLAALDAHLLAAGLFAPTQTERWAQAQELLAMGRASPAMAAHADAFAWGYHFKVDPGAAPPRDSGVAWRQARRAILEAVPIALRHAGLPDLDAYARRDGLVDRAVFVRRSSDVAQARRWARHPTGRVRVGTLRLLAQTPDGRVVAEAARDCLRPVAREADDPLALLDGLRRATLQ